MQITTQAVASVGHQVVFDSKTSFHIDPKHFPLFEEDIKNAIAKRPQSTSGGTATFVLLASTSTGATLPCLKETGSTHHTIDLGIHYLDSLKETLKKIKSHPDTK